MRRMLGQITWIAAALAAVLFARPSIAEARGCGGGGGGPAAPAAPRPSASARLGGATSQVAAERSGRSAAGANPRVTIDWREFKLAVPAEAEYGETAAPLQEMVDRAVEKTIGQAPAFVLIVDERAEERNAAVEKVLTNKEVAVALKRFVCLKASVDSIPDERMREEVRRHAPLVYTFDSAGAGIALIEGRRAGSRSTLFAGVEKAFRQSYTLSLKEYTRATLNIMDRLDEIQRERARISAKFENASDAKRASLERELERLDAAREKVREAEQALVDACALRPAPSDDETASK